MRQKALELIEKAIVTEGIQASIQDKDNYKRIWARDSVLAGLAGLWAENFKIKDGLLASLKTLAQHQSPAGQLPSNVDYIHQKVSYGGLVGRTDATLWWLVGLVEYIKKTESHHLIGSYEKQVQSALDVLRAWEYNERGLLYSPLGGNWADEYVTQGYTLYDNCLYLWALEGVGEVFSDAYCKAKAIRLRQLLIDNFFIENPVNENITYYHPSARKAIVKGCPYPVAALAPNGYDMRFDMAGTALSLYLKLWNKSQTKQIENWLQQLAEKQKNWLLPVFYPVIFPDQKDWELLSNNYSYAFKNEPYHFHNGGCWTIWLGFLAYSLKQNGLAELQTAIQQQIKQSLKSEPEPYSFYEYRSTNNFEIGGVAQLCFSASGAIFSTL